MKKTFKILSLILALVMSVSVFAVLPAFAVENTDYTVSNDSNTGKTTYTVKTATGLNEVVALVNAADSSNVIITLANDITFNEGWTSAELMAYAKDGTIPTGKTDPTVYVPLATVVNTSNKVVNPFKGTFDGNGKTLSGLYVSRVSGSQGKDKQGAALIGFGVGCTVKDLTIERSYFYCTSGYVGGIIGNSYTAASTVNNVVIDDVKLSTSAATSYAGGIFGATYKGNNVLNTIVKNVEITGGSHLGGISGYSEGAALNVSNSVIDVKISGTTKTGGVVGEIKHSLSMQNVVVAGSVTGTGVKNGGFSGCINAGANEFTISNSISNAKVSGSSETGAIFGYNYQTTNVTFSNVYASKDLLDRDEVNAYAASGGTGVTATTVDCLVRADLAAKIVTLTNFELDTEAYSAIFGSSIVAVQAGTDGAATTPTPSIRFISTLDGVDYYSVGLIIKLTKVGTGTGTVDKETKAVYTSVLADGKPETAESFDADYLCAIGVNKLTAGVYKFEITSYVKTDANTVYYTDTATVDYELTSSGVALINGEEA